VKGKSRREHDGEQEQIDREAERQMLIEELGTVERKLNTAKNELSQADTLLDEVEGHISKLKKVLEE
jgi:archaellum component FlaC